MPEYEFIKYEVKGPTRLITLNRPETLNAMTEPMEADLHAALDVAEADPEARVIIIQGAGRAFSSGYDIASFGETDPVSMIPEGSSAAEHTSRWFYHDRNMLKKSDAYSGTVQAGYRLRTRLVHGRRNVAVADVRHDVLLGGRRIRPAGGAADFEHQLPVGADGGVQERSAIFSHRRPHRRPGSVQDWPGQ